MTQNFFVATIASDPAEVASHLQDDGCVLLKQVISKDCIKELSRFVYAEVERFKAIFLSHIGIDWHDSQGLKEFIGLDPLVSPKYEALSDELKHLIRGELPLEVRISPNLKAICNESAFLKFIRASLGDSTIRMHHPPSVRVSFPGIESALVPLHQDGSYAWHLKDFLTVWVPLCPIDATTGGIEILPGSHRLPLLEHQRQAIWQEMSIDFSPGELVPIFCQVGDAIIFGPRLLHRSRSNLSNRTRCSIDYRFFSRSTETSKRFYDLEARKVCGETSSE